MIIVDTSFIISLFNGLDINNPQASRMFTSYKESNEALLINEYVVQELVALGNIKFKECRERIYSYCNDLLFGDYSFLKFEKFDLNDFLEIYNLSLLHTDISFTDCSVVYSASKYKNSTVLSFDKKLLTKLK